MNPQQQVNTDQAIASMISSFGEPQSADIFSTTPPQPQYQQQPQGYPMMPQAQTPYQQPQYIPPTPPAPGQPFVQQPQQPYLQPGVQMPQQGQPQYQQPGQMQMQPGQQQQPQGPLPEYPIVMPQQMQMQPQQQAQQQLTPEQIQQIVASTVQQQQAGQPSDDWPDRPQTWGQLRQTIQTEAQKIAQEQLQAFTTQQQQQAQQQQQQMEAAQAAIDQTEQQLRQLGYLPQIANPMDPSDAGLMAQRELEAYAVATQSNNLFATATSLKALHDSGYYYDRFQSKLVRRGSQTQAARAPIAGASPSIGPVSGQQGPTQQQLATNSLDQLMQYGLATIQ